MEKLLISTETFRDEFLFETNSNVFESFKNSKPSEEDQDFSLDEPRPMSVQNEKNMQKQEKNDVASDNEKKEEILFGEEQEEMTTLLDNVEEGYMSDYENDSENGCDSSNFGDSDIDDEYSDDSSNFSDDDDNNDLNLRADEFIAKINERWRAERLIEYNLYIVN
ncbi:uncharacterized protein LOC113272316 [Papaver somniferum]|uniref:uncharacterized protein LOC113272313 n=1 Tax=Papaver somniferum TaxID=3469 RepID=UPI000E6FD901|nr:uncharacterized protein LOC113272313 [Papaver somniferum]XP_026377954.1 uncharacterized protein LOC113272316 [Papaver somniferum]